MKSEELLQKLCEYYGENEIILASKAYKEYFADNLNETAFYKQLERLCNGQKLFKLSKGIYYVPKQSKFGIVPISENSIVNTFTKNQSGTVVGYTLYNRLGLTTQIAKTIYVMSSNLDGLTKTLNNIKVQKVNLEFTGQTVEMVQMMEVLLHFDEIQDLNYKAFKKYAENFCLNYSDEVFAQVNQVIKYPKWAISFLENVLNFYGAKNNLKKHLSSLSKYNHQRMEDIYALT